MIMVISAFMHACRSSQTEMGIVTIPPCWQSLCFHERYMINFLLVCWLTMLEDRLHLGEEQQLSSKDQVSYYGLIAETLDLGLHYVRSGV